MQLRAPLDRARGAGHRRRPGLVCALVLLQAVAGTTAAAGGTAAIGREGPAPEWRQRIAQYRDVAHGWRAAAALVVECRGDRPAMLAVLHVRGGRLLLSLPGGRAEPGETPADTAVRETLEETGHGVRAKRRLASPPEAAPGLAVVLAEVAAQRGGGPRSGEVVASLWVDPRRIPAGAWRFAGDRQWVIPLFEQHAPADCR